MSPTDQPASWRDDLAPGAIVSFTFPSQEGDPALEKARPALVLAVEPGDGGAPMVTLAYGTGSRSGANRGLELRLRSRMEVTAAGLHKPTRFVGARTTRVHRTSPRFVECGHGTAILGHLPDRLLPRLERVRAAVAREARAPRRRGYLRRPQRRNLRPAAGTADAAAATPLASGAPAALPPAGTSRWHRSAGAKGGEGREIGRSPAPT